MTADDITVVEVALVQKLKQKKLKISTVESCTGGLIASKIVNVSGASAVFEQGFVTYSNAAKTSMVGVPAELITKFGVVSAPVAESMASCGAAVSGADVCVSVTGYAGPDGGTDEDPVGTCYIGCYYKGNSHSERLCFAGDRGQVREQAACMALSIALDELND